MSYHDHDPAAYPLPKVRTKTAAEAFGDEIQRLHNERDRAVGAVLLLAHDGVISHSRAAELLGMTALQWRAEFKRLAEANAALSPDARADHTERDLFIAGLPEEHGAEP